MTIQHASQAQPPTVLAEGPFMPDMEPEDFAPPEIRLVQSASKAHYDGGASLGTYFCDMTGEVAESLDLVILSIQRNRTLWKQGDLNFPICSSDDRIIPRPGGAYPGPCAKCPLCNKGCFPGYNLICVRLGEKDEVSPSNMFLLRVGHTSVFPFRKLWSRIKMQHANVHWSVAIRLSSDEKTNDKGPPYFVMRPDIEHEFKPGGDTWQAVRLLAMYAAGIGRAASHINTEAIAEAANTQAPGSTVASSIEYPAVDVPRSLLVRLDSGDPATAPQAPKSGLVRSITQLEANQTANLAKWLNADPKLVSAFIANTFGKQRLSQLHTGELAMLTKWLEQEFRALPQKPESSPMDNLPF